MDLSPPIPKRRGRSPGRLVPPRPALASADGAPPLVRLMRAAGNQATGRLLGADEGPSAEPEAAEPETEGSTDRDAAPDPVVEDDAQSLAPGQMRKSEFLARLRPALTAATRESLAGTEHEERAPGLIETYLGEYETRDAGRINADLARLVGEGPRPRTAEGYVDLIAGRVRVSAARWARTGEVSGVPPGFTIQDLGIPGLDALGGLGGGLAAGLLRAAPGALLKPREGGARAPGDPGALPGPLGPGHLLDG